MNAQDSAGIPGAPMDPGSLDGHTIEELSDYLEAGCSPPDPSIDASPGCRIALDSLRRLRALSPRLLAADTAAEPAPDEGWVQGILAGISLDARAGRRTPIGAPVPAADLGVTEGAIRGIVRAAEHAVPGVLVGACRLHGDVTVPDAPVRIDVEVSVLFGTPIPELVDRLRAEVFARLARNTTLRVTGIDITVDDVRPPMTEEYA